MSKLSLFTQIIMIVVAVLILFFYIKPTIAEVRAVQETTETYEAEAEKVAAVNQLLETQLNKVDSVNQADAEALQRYLPNNLDEISVMKDLSAILATEKITPTDISFTSSSTVESTSAVPGDIIGLTNYLFSISALVTYDELKALLKAIEINDYLLQIDTLEVKPSEDSDSLMVTMELRTFSKTAAMLADVPVATEEVIE